MGCHGLLQGIEIDPGIEPGSPALQADSLPSEPPGKLLLAKLLERKESPVSEHISDLCYWLVDFLKNLVAYETGQIE